MTDYRKKLIKNSVISLLQDQRANQQIALAIKGISKGQTKDYVQLVVDNDNAKQKSIILFHEMSIHEFLELLDEGVVPRALILDSTAIIAMGGNFPEVLSGVNIFFYENTSVSELYSLVPKAMKKDIQVPLDYLLRSDSSTIFHTRSLDVLVQVQPIASAMCIKDFSCLCEALDVSRKTSKARLRYIALRKTALAKPNVRSCIVVGNTKLDFQAEEFSVAGERISLSFAARCMLMNMFYFDKRDNKGRVMLSRIRKDNPLFLQDFNTKLTRFYAYVK